MPPRRGQKDAAAAGMNEWRNGKFSAISQPLPIIAAGSGGEQLWARDDAQCDCRTSYRASADCTALFRLSFRYRCLHAHCRGAAFFAHSILFAEMLLVMLLLAGGPSLRTMIGQHSYLPRFRATLCWLLHLAAAFHDHLLIVLTLIIGPLMPSSRR